MIRALCLLATAHGKALVVGEKGGMQPMGVGEKGKYRAIGWV